MVIMLIIFALVFILSSFQCCSAAASRQQQNQKNQTPVSSFDVNRIGASAIFPLRGNVYPDGYVNNSQNTFYLLNLHFVVVVVFLILVYLEIK